MITWRNQKFIFIFMVSVTLRDTFFFRFAHVTWSKKKKITEVHVDSAYFAIWNYCLERCYYAKKMWILIINAQNNNSVCRKYTSRTCQNLNRKSIDFFLITSRNIIKKFDYCTLIKSIFVTHYWIYFIVFEMPKTLVVWKP